MIPSENSKVLRSTTLSGGINCLGGKGMNVLVHVGGQYTSIILWTGLQLSILVKGSVTKIKLRITKAIKSASKRRKKNWSSMKGLWEEKEPQLILSSSFLFLELLLICKLFGFMTLLSKEWHQEWYRYRWVKNRPNYLCVVNFFRY